MGIYRNTILILLAATTALASDPRGDEMKKKDNEFEKYVNSNRYQFAGDTEVWEDDSIRVVFLHSKLEKGVIVQHAVSGDYEDRKLITDKVAQKIANLDRIELLTLMSAPELTDAGLKLILKKHKNYLVKVNLNDATGIKTGADGLIWHCTHLTSVTLLCTGLTDKDVKGVSKCKKLEFLVLAGTKVTDICCDEISKVKTLKRLSIMKTEISDVGFMKVMQMPSLQYIAIGSSRVTRAAIEKARRLRPDMIIDIQTYKEMRK